MPLEVIEHLLPGHAGRGRSGYRPGLIVLHIQDGYGDPWGWFNSLGTSGPNAADCTIWNPRSTSGKLVRYLKDEDTAWTNGGWDRPDLSNPVIADYYNRRIYSGDVSLTIEHEGRGGEGATAAQIERSAQIIAYWCKTWNIPCDRYHVVGHYQVGPHKYCPGSNFPFDAIVNRAKEILTGLTVTTQGGPVAEENPNGKHFPETGHWVTNFLPDGRVTKFYDYWKSKGLADLGYPISPARYMEDNPNLVEQWFERARLEHHPENAGTQYEVQRGLLGRECVGLREEKANLKAEIDNLKALVATLQSKLP